MDGDAVGPGRQGEDHLRPVGPVVAAVAVCRKLLVPGAVEVAAGQVVQHKGRRLGVGARVQGLLYPRPLAGQGVHGNSLLFSHADVHGQEDACGSVDGHGSGDLVKRNLVEKNLHVPETVNGDADFSALSLSHGVVGVVSYLGGQVEGHRKARGSLGKQVAVPFVRLFGSCEARILAHGPEASPVHGGLHASGKRVLPRKAYVFYVVGGRQTVRSVKSLKGQSPPGGEIFLSLLVSLKNLCHARLEFRFGILILRTH